jgi:hypothetical protein
MEQANVGLYGPNCTISSGGGRGRALSVFVLIPDWKQCPLSSHDCLRQRQPHIVEGLSV